MVSTGRTTGHCILLDNGGRTSARNGCKSYNGETSREKKRISVWFVRKCAGTHLWSLLPTLSALGNISGGDNQVLGPPDSRTPQNPPWLMLLLLYGPEESGTDLSWRIFNETRWDRANEVVVCIQIEYDQETHWRRDPRVG